MSTRLDAVFKAHTAQARLRAVIADLTAQASAIRAAAEGPEVRRGARGRALARAGGLRDAATQMQEAIREDNQQ